MKTCRKSFFKYKTYLLLAFAGTSMFELSYPLTPLNFIQTQKTPIFFIHIGDDPEYFPDFIYSAVRQAATWNPFTPIHVILPRCHEYRESIMNLTRDVQHMVHVWYIEDLTVSDIHTRFKDETKLEVGGFRSGFWRFTTERLFVLLDAMVMLRVNECVHLENDNLLYVGIDSILPILRQEYPGLAVEPHGTVRCTAGFLYVQQVSALGALLEHMTEVPSTDEMRSLAIFRENNGPFLIGLLPVISPIDCLGASVSMFSSNFFSFGGLFDAAPHGQYIGGPDPRNKNGGPGFVNSERGLPYRVDDFEYKWRSDSVTNLGRFYIHRLHAISKSVGCNASVGKLDEFYPLFQLHVHSKELFKFVSYKK
jgi:hypothetical protein